MDRLPRFILALILVATGGESLAEDPALRDFILSVLPDEVEIEFPAEPWVVVMETCIEQESSLALVAIIGGAVRIDSSSSSHRSSTLAPAGDDSDIRAASEELFSDASKYLRYFSLVDRPSPPPALGKIAFHIRVGESLMRFEANEDVLRNGNHELSTLFYKANNLITAVRQRFPQYGD